MADRRLGWKKGSEAAPGHPGEGRDPRTTGTRRPSVSPRDPGLRRDDGIFRRSDGAKGNPVNAEYETRAKNPLKGELNGGGLTYAMLAEKLAAIGVSENERNLNNKISRGGFTAVFLLQCLEVIGASELRL